MAKIETFTANLTREGSTGSVRGKVPATLISAMGGNDGDVIEFQLNGKTLVGGRIITGKEARGLRSQGRKNFGSSAPAPVAKAKAVAAPASKAKATGKAVAKKAPVAVAKKATAKAAPVAAKSSKNKTSVAVGKAKSKGQGKRVNPRFSL